MRDPVAVLRSLREAPDSFDFHAALRLLENAWPSQPRIGCSQRLEDDAVRFGQQPALAFVPAMFDALIDGEEGEAPRLLLGFFGLLGANGPLPLHLTEYIRDRLRHAGDATAARFLDIFHHRMTALFYRAWANGQPAVSLDRPEDDRFAAYVGSLVGIGMPSLQGRDAVPDFARLHHAGRLVPHVRNAEGLAALLSDFFRVPVSIEQFVGHWLRLPADGICRLRSGHHAAVLGVDTVVGTRVWNCQHKFRIVMGPLDLAQLRRLLPGGDSLPRLQSWVRHYAGLGFDWDINLVLKKEQVPRLQLGSASGSRLGWSAWLSSSAPAHDDRQVLLNPARFDHST